MSATTDNLNGRHVLVVEDETRIAAVLADYLRHDGFCVSLLTNGDMVIPFLRQHPADLMVLDLMLPGIDGMAIYRALREFSDMPVIMATARVDETTRLEGLGMGVDDYVCKPYSPRELVMRINNVLRRYERSQPAVEVQESALLALDDDLLEARVLGQLLELTISEYRLLAQLARHPGQVFARAQLLDCLHEDFRDVTDRAVDSHIKNLRRKIQQFHEGESPIRSVYGVGYKYQAP